MSDAPQNPGAAQNPGQNNGEKAGPAIAPEVHEVQAVFASNAALEDAIGRLREAGFDHADFSLPHAHPAAGEATPEQGADDPVTHDDQQQMRTMETSMAGTVGAFAAAGRPLRPAGPPRSSPRRRWRPAPARAPWRTPPVMPRSARARASASRRRRAANWCWRCARSTPSTGAAPRRCCAKPARRGSRRLIALPPRSPAASISSAWTG